MNLKKTIKLSMRYFTSIHPTRKHVLEHLFAVLGNGYDWINGELVETCGADEIYKIPIKEWRHKNILDSVEFSKKFDKIFPERKKLTEEQRYRLAKKQIKKRIEENKETRFTWYPMSKEYSQLLTFPEDIKDDWLDGVIETCQYILEDKGYIGEPDHVITEEYCKKRSEQNVKIASSTLKRALKIKKERQKR